jgi:hypothetical protein
LVEGSSGISALGEGGILKGIKLYSKIMQNPVLKKEFDSIINIYQGLILLGRNVLP